MPPSLHPDGLPAGLRFWAMTTILLGSVMAVLDGSIANIALPTIARQLAATPAAAVWVVNAYQLVIVATLLPLAALGELVGYRRVYAGGLVLFTLGSLACALSHSLPLLVGSRILQGLGAAGLMSVGGALIRHTWPLAMLGRGVGLNALFVSLAGALGPSVAAAVLAVTDWEWLFALNVPLGLINLVMAHRFLPVSEPADGKLDRIGTVLNVLVFGLFFVGVDGLVRGGSGHLAGAAGLLMALLLGAAAVWRSSGQARPLIPVDLLRIPVFALSICASICAFGSYALAFLLLPFHFEDALHLGQVRTGLLMTAWPAAIALIGPLAGRLSDRVAPALLGGFGMVLLAAGMLLLATMPACAGLPSIAWRMAVCGAGFGLFQSPNNRVMLGTAPRHRAGAAGGMLATARLFGQTLGVTLAAICFRLFGHGSAAFGLSTSAVLAVLAACFSAGRFRRATR